MAIITIIPGQYYFTLLSYDQLTTHDLGSWFFNELQISFLPHPWHFTAFIYQQLRGMLYFALEQPANYTRRLYTRNMCSTTGPHYPNRAGACRGINCEYHFKIIYRQHSIASEHHAIYNGARKRLLLDSLDDGLTCHREPRTNAQSYIKIKIVENAMPSYSTGALPARDPRVW